MWMAGDLVRHCHTQELEMMLGLGMMKVVILLTLLYASAIDRIAFGFRLCS